MVDFTKFLSHSTTSSGLRRTYVVLLIFLIWLSITGIFTEQRKQFISQLLIESQSIVLSLEKVTWQYLCILSGNRMRKNTWTMYLLLTGYMEKMFSTNLKEQMFIRCVKFENHICFIVKVQLHNQRRQAWLRGFLAKCVLFTSGVSSGTWSHSSRDANTMLSTFLYPFKLHFSPACSIRSM